ncbi:MAG: hypothetical protein PHP59_10755 [Methanofollis sp.]|uniref:hypothetical protein n=1 Tax=Methanofollis sp. TaxID=2052835 RepID=UPI00261CFEBE|nr:hypothetical protein [Methanofollis sp.]MDD4255838.1 hypothetical protein [Methanofollis sp.]
MPKDLIEEIPPLARWRFATRATSLLPALYSRALREGEGTVEEREQLIWYEIGREVGEIAETFGFPTETAEEISEVVRAGAVVLFGPDFRVSVLATSSERATVVVKACPYTRCLAGAGGDTATGFSWCFPFAVSAVEHLNPAFTLRFVRARCMGEAQCEMTVRRKEESEL